MTGAPPELIRVLGDHGGTDLRSLMYGLDQVSTRPNWSPSNTLVNMSLALEPPTECLPNIVHNTDGVRGTLSTPSATMPGAFTQCTETVTTIARTPRDARLFVPIGLVMNSMVSDGFTLVAAAGNESTATSHLGADMPGAFCGVYSVAAVDGLVKPAIGTTSPLAAYSNLPSLDGDPVSGANGNCIAAPIDFTSGSPSVPSVIANPIQYGSNARLAYATGTNVCSYFGDPKYAPPGYTGPPLFAGERALWMGTSFSTPAITALLAGARTYDQPCG